MEAPLEIFSRSALEPLATAFGKKVLIYYLGREFGLNKARLTLVREHKSPDSDILALCKLIKSLPPPERALWDSAKSRSFDIGIEAPAKGSYYWSAISPKAVREAAEVNAQIDMTVYGPMKTKGRTKRKRTADPMTHGGLRDSVAVEG